MAVPTRYPNSSRRLAATILGATAIALGVAVVTGMVSGANPQRESGEAWQSVINAQIVLGAITLFILGMGSVPLVRLWRGQRRAGLWTGVWLALVVLAAFAWFVARIMVDES